MFKRAISHFKVFNCKRMKQYLSKLYFPKVQKRIFIMFIIIKGICMAEEYYYAKDYQESLKSVIFYIFLISDPF